MPRGSSCLLEDILEIRKLACKQKMVRVPGAAPGCPGSKPGSNLTLRPPCQMGNGAHGRTRTCIGGIRNPVLIQLSYASTNGAGYPNRTDFCGSSNHRYDHISQAGIDRVRGGASCSDGPADCTVPVRANVRSCTRTDGWLADVDSNHD